MHKLHYENKKKLVRARRAVKAVEEGVEAVAPQSSELSLARQKSGDLEGEELVYWVYNKLGGSTAETGYALIPEAHQPEEEEADESEEEKDVLTCDNCGKEYTSEHYFEKHVKDCDE